ncbi:MAG: hypothetical protein M3Z75_17125 [Actinomycetota bacterium]|nr:hypothetical protein [Actinomycetota bacterium]
MTNDISGEILSPSRRALLKAAVAGGAFAVPLIASFSMDTASAQTKAEALHSSNQVIVSNMFCSNMTRVPDAVFFAVLQQLNEDDFADGPAVGLAGLEFVPGRDELRYELAVQGTVTGFSVSFGGSFFEVLGRGKTGTIRESALNCGPDGLSTVYRGLVAGGATIEVDLSNDTSLQGMFIPLGQDSPFRDRFRFTGQG